MKELLARVDTTLNIVEMLTQDIGFYNLPQEVQKKINSAACSLEEAYELLEVEAIKEKDINIKALYEFIEHGGQEHKDWLKEALNCFFKNEPKPEYKA